MPTFSEDPIQGVSISDADLEAAAIAPVRRAMLTCLEFHSAEWSAPARVVADKQDFTAVLEDDAPRNAGESVTFTALPLRAKWPSEGKAGQAPKVELEIDGVSSLLADLMDQAVVSLEPIELILRQYASDDPSGPSRLPVLTMEFQDVKVTENTVSGTCAYGDPTNDRFPAAAYTRLQWPGLNAR